MNDKAELRTQLRARRAALTAGERDAAAAAIAVHGVRLLARRAQARAIVGAYWPVRGEADPRPLARALAACGARLALPVVHGDAMTFRRWANDDALVPAGFGALGPAAEAPAVVPTLVLAPLVGFDARGMRLGQGKGYYDRWLQSLRTRPFVCGVAFACQQVAAVPSEAHDQRLDAVVTEQGVRTW
jgi:5-formyltetrahydrofolate cyclo-ligase